MLWFTIALCILSYSKYTNGIKNNSSKIEESYPNLSPYPTNYFTETVKHFINNRPIIGVVAMRMKGGKTLSEYPALIGQDYFGASFVKWVESVGGRVVPIPEVISLLNVIIFKVYC